MVGKNTGLVNIFLELSGSFYKSGAGCGRSKFWFTSFIDILLIWLRKGPLQNFKLGKCIMAEISGFVNFDIFKTFIKVQFEGL